MNDGTNVSLLQDLMLKIYLNPFTLLTTTDTGSIFHNQHLTTKTVLIMNSRSLRCEDKSEYRNQKIRSPSMTSLSNSIVVLYAQQRAVTVDDWWDGVTVLGPWWCYCVGTMVVGHHILSVSERGKRLRCECECVLSAHWEKRLWCWPSSVDTR